MVLYFGKSALNPLIYGWKNLELRRALIRLIQRRRSARAGGHGTSHRRASTAISFIDLQQTSVVWHQNNGNAPRRSQSHRTTSAASSSKVSFLRRLRRSRTTDLTETAARARAKEEEEENIKKTVSVETEDNEKEESGERKTVSL